MSEKELEKINKKLDDILEELKCIRASNEKLSNHIDFVDTTYESLRAPLDYIKSKFSYLGGGSSPLPIKDENKK